ncbi:MULTISPECIES: energy transducer TonB [Neisseria]|uniref:TonB family C-terminal domain protein n=1 Tax=Neisseria musculi TaxID=1815583 RepID=A0A7H1M9M2_9NEIS|nr:MULTISPECIES: TonB family protein [Neisseria]MBF0804262.1 TonB family protein [Neisseria sp. 19428wB4_WF04]QNT58337.1 tonB family C-terminal domain protein [Neisseria musculi]TFU42995.1 TonB family protein [Neisseria sp. WF04]
MKIQRALSTVATFALLAGAQAAFAQGVTFHHKTSDAAAPISGNLAMRITINAEGNVSDARVIRSSGSAGIDAEAVNWIEAQYLRPVTMNGDPIDFSVIKEINFSKNAPVQHAGLAQ